MRIIITSGPSYEPLDGVRRLSNFSTGELGTLLAEGFAAALCDYRVKEIRDAEGSVAGREKVPSRRGELQVTLEPVPKLIASLRRLFPASILVGWKYELDGTAQELAGLGREQIEECLTDACVLNGAAYGPGFGVLMRSAALTHVPDKAGLCRFLVDWAERMPMASTTPGQESFHALATFLPLSPFI